jgi:branched-chain amino acid transport system permease protein
VRILFKTSYLDDIRLLKHRGYSFWYGLLVVALMLAPSVLAEFYVGELSQIFILAIAGIGLMLLIGYTGLASLGHDAFMAIGAYTDAYLMSKGVPFRSRLWWQGSSPWRPASPSPCRPTA